VAIHFQNKEEMEYVYRLLLEDNRSESLDINQYGWTLDVRVKEGEPENILFLLGPLESLIIHKKRNEWFRKVLEEQFYYQDSYEQAQIIEMIHSILDGKRKGLILPERLLDTEGNVREALKEVLLAKDSFSLEAFLTFRLRSFFEKMMELVEIAIDEYKLEQDYQMFIQYLRDFISSRTSQKECIYIVHDGDEFLFFDENRREMKRSELNQSIDRKLLSDHPIYVDSNIIAPLISINPKKIYLFTDHPEQGIVQTLCQVFDENLIVKPFRGFGVQKEK